MAIAIKFIRDWIVDFIMKGARPFRILLVGGVFLAMIFMTTASHIFDIDQNAGGDVTLSNVLLITGSMFSGFFISYCVIHLAGASKQKRDIS